MEALAGFIGGLVGAVIGAATTLTVQRRGDEGQSRRAAAGLVGRLRVLVDEFVPGRWMQAPDWDLDPVLDDLRALEGDWREMRPQLLALPVLFPKEAELIDRIHDDMGALTRGVWLFARHSYKGYDVDKELKDLESRHAAMKSALDELTRGMAGKR